MASTQANKDDVWITRDNEQIPISKLTDSHLKNIYKMCRKKNIEYKCIRNEMIKRGFTDMIVLSPVIELWEIEHEDDYSVQAERWWDKFE
jgi:hypothetical protein